MVVQPIGTIVFELAGQKYHIAADALEQRGMMRNSSAILKDDTEDWSTTFTAAHAVGEFTWLVSFSKGLADASLDTFELVKQPAGVEIVSGMDFELVEG